jgi:hypothetical protein
MRFTIFLFSIMTFTICNDVQYDFQTLELSPISTFEEKCSRCHGSQGSFYGEAFANLEESKLKQTVKEMMEGPAFLQPTETEIVAMVDYQKALAKKMPFVVIKKVENKTDGILILGETLPESVLTYAQNKTTFPIEIDADGNWKLTLKTLEKIEFKAVLNGRETVLNPLESQWK